MATSPPLAPIRLIAIDIDGTLLNSDGQIPRANHLAIDKAIQHGVEVVLATGRTFHHARPIAQRLDQPLASHQFVSNEHVGQAPLLRPGDRPGLQSDGGPIAGKP